MIYTNSHSTLNLNLNKHNFSHGLREYHQSLSICRNATLDVAFSITKLSFTTKKITHLLSTIHN